MAGGKAASVFLCILALSGLLGSCVSMKPVATQPARIYLGPDDVMGLVGMKLMSRFRVVFDYSNNRIALIPAVVATSAVPPASATLPASAHPIDGVRPAGR